MHGVHENGLLQNFATHPHYLEATQVSPVIHRLLAPCAHTELVMSQRYQPPTHTHTRRFTNTQTHMDLILCPLV